MPRIVVGLAAGVWVDRLQRRPLLIATNIARTVLFLGVAATAAVGLLGIELLYVVGLLMAALGVVFGITLQAYFPSLVPKGERRRLPIELVEGVHTLIGNPILRASRPPPSWRSSSTA